MLNNLHVFCQGESHKDSDKPCQDYCFSMVDDQMALAIVCDGHGGDRYFRSNPGSQFATEVITQVVTDFVRTTDPKLFKDAAYTEMGVTGSSDKKLKLADLRLRQMFSSIITLWNERIDRHAHENPLTEWELQNVPQKYLDEFKSNLDKPSQISAFNKQYGCTLMAYVQTKHYWLAFHLGDGKCVSFHTPVNLHGNAQVWDEPIPWDDRCFLNKTTSICDSDAINEFRYCYQGDGNFPTAIFLGSDGIDDTYGDMENIANFYVEIMKIIVKDGLNAAIQQLTDDLPIISRIGSKDDCAVAAIYNPERLKSDIGSFVTFQLEYMDAQARTQEERILHLQEKRQSLQRSIATDSANIKKSEIELGYAEKDLARAADRLEILSGKIDVIAKEHTALTGKSLESLPDYSETIESARGAISPVAAEEADNGDCTTSNDVTPSSDDSQQDS